jgi:hypothetical protein
MWFGGAKQSCSVSTLKSLIRNMINGTINVRRYIIREDWGSLASSAAAKVHLSFLCSFKFNLLIIINMDYRATDTR